MGVAYERDIQNVWWLGVPRTGLRTTALDDQVLRKAAGPVLVVFCKPQPGFYLLLMDEGLFSALPPRACMEPSSPCTSPQLMLVILFVGHFDVILRLLSDIRMSLVVIHQWRVVFILCRSVVLLSSMSQCIPLPVKPELNPSFPHSPFGMFSSYFIPFTLEVLTSTVFVFQLQESYCKRIVKVFILFFIK